MMEQIKELRDKTGAGMVDCQKALKESNGDIGAAIEILRKKGIAKAAKRGDRESAEGVIVLALSDDKKSAYMLEVSAETDFVARNEKFRNFADNALEILRKTDTDDLAVFLGSAMSGTTVGETLAALSGTVGEKMEIRRIAALKTEGSLAAYSHQDGRIGVLVSLDRSGQEETARDIAMHIAAANPRYLDNGQVPDAELAKEKEIYREQLAKEGKPENIMDKIIAGKIAKYYEENCLLDQEYIKDDKMKVAQVLGEAKIEKFIRFALN